jgi:hypothetical protein
MSSTISTVRTLHAAHACPALRSSRRSLPQRAASLGLALAGAAMLTLGTLSDAHAAMANARVTIPPAPWTEASDPFEATVAFNNTNPLVQEAARASASAGALHAFATASVSPSVSYGSAAAQAYASYTDAIHVDVPADFGPVTLRFGISLAGACLFDGRAGGGVIGSGCSAGERLDGRDTTLGKDFTLTLGDAGQAVTTIVTRPGATIGFQTSLLVGGYSHWAPFTAAYYDTGHVYIESLTPGVSLTSDSGHNYAPVPEPATWALMLGGLTCAGLYGRRRRQAKQA